MNLTPEQKQQVNIAVAKDMGIYLKPLQGIPCDDPCSVVTSSTGNSFNIFNPDNTTDLNKAVEYYGVNVVKLSPDNMWVCSRMNLVMADMEFFPEHGSRDESMRMAVVKASGGVL